MEERFAALRGLWPGFAADLRALGVETLEALRGADPAALARRHAETTGRSLDAVVEDVFASAIRFAETGEPRPWWAFTRERLAGGHRPPPVLRERLRSHG